MTPRIPRSRLFPSMLMAAAAVAGPFLAGGSPAAGQTPTLAGVDSLISAGEYETARTALGLWWAERNQRNVPGSDMARGLMLRARLESDPRTAESDYLSVVLGYPASPYAAEALLRLGQGLLATGDATRAAAYLNRLVTDYPGRLQRPATLLWLARAHHAARRTEAACSAARAGLEDTRDPALEAMLRVEAGASCAVSGAASPAAGGRATAEEATADRPGVDRTTAGQTTEPETGAAGDWTVQTGAFRQRASADALMERLQRAGHSPRLVRVPRSDLLRVRVGRFTTSAAASAARARLQREGFEAVVVRDAAQERDP